MEMKVSKVFLGLGSNLGNRLRMLQAALDELAAEGIRLQACSSVYETEPVDVTDQPWFLNLVCRAEVGLPPRDLLQLCHRVEARLGRRREVPKGPRTIDIDILFFDGLVTASPDLVLPHPRVASRRFVLVPLEELASTWRDPRSGMLVRDLLVDCTDRAAVELYGPALRIRLQ